MLVSFNLTFLKNSVMQASHCAEIDTRIKHENEPSQGYLAIFWHAKDFATAHEVGPGT